MMKLVMVESYLGTRKKLAAGGWRRQRRFFGCWWRAALKVTACFSEAVVFNDLTDVNVNQGPGQYV